MTLRFLPPSDFLLEGVAQDLEEADINELQASTGIEDLADILKASRDLSFECYVLMVGDTPLAVFGATILTECGTYGCPWAVLTKSMRRHPREIMKVSRTVLARWKAMFPFLENMVDQRNTRAIKWLKRLGFEMKNEVPSVGGPPFTRFEMRNV